MTKISKVAYALTASTFIFFGVATIGTALHYLFAAVPWSVYPVLAVEVGVIAASVWMS